ncbi:MAG: SPOR domain-containing protein [Terriglobales bacterium]|jgi:DedD protein
MTSSMASSEDTEITLGTGKLLVLFFVLVAICAGSFSLGYKLGSKSEPAVSSAVSLTTTPGVMKPASSTMSAPASASKPVEQKSATPDPGAAAADAKTVTPGDSSNSSNGGAAGNSGANASAANPSSANPSSVSPTSSTPDPSTTLPASSYFVQVAAVSKQDDADALVDALKKKNYPAFVAANAATDKLFRIQVGPFPDIQEAEAMRTRLIGDGYNPIVKK